MAVDRPLFQPFPMLTGRRGQVWRYAPEYRRPRHFHKEPELNLVVAGRGAFGTGRATLSVAAGDLICWPPGVDHELLAASPDFDLFVMALTPELSERALGAQHWAAISGPQRVRVEPGRLGELRVACAAELPVDAAVSDARVVDVWREAHAARRLHPARTGLADRVLRSVLERPELSRSERSLLIRGCPSELSREFGRRMGLTLTEYRTRLRLLRFIQLADGGARSLLAAALDAGFGSYSQCHRAFRRSLGCTPRMFLANDARRRMSEAFAPWSPRSALAASRVPGGVALRAAEQPPSDRPTGCEDG